MSTPAGSIAERFATAIAHHQAGRLAEAEPLYRQILAADPAHAHALHLLGVIAHQLGRNELAVELIGQAIALNDRVPEFHSNLGLALKELGRLDDAVARYRKALALRPDYPDAHSNLGIALQSQRRLDEAGDSYRRAIKFRPDYAEAHFNLGVVLKDQGRLDEAIACYRRALEFKPDFAGARNNLGIALKEQGRLDEAVVCYRKAIELNAGYMEAYHNLATALWDQGQLDDAVVCYRKAIELKPDFAEPHYSLGNALTDQGLLDAALESFGHAVARSSTALHYGYATELLLPKIPSSVDAISFWRARYEAGIEKLWAITDILDDPEAKLSINSFDLAYHNADNRQLMETLCRLFRDKAPALAFTAAHLRNWQPPAENRRLRVGFLSQFLGNHTIGRLYQGFMRQLDRTRFELVLIHGPKAKRDAVGARLDALADTALRLSPRLAQQQQQIAAAQLDVLFYPDIGMSPATYYLAYARLAPVQAVSWGHPDTTGLDSIDYFVSADAIEPPDAEAQYSERLVRLNRLPCYYEPPVAPATIPTRTAFGLPASGILYGCPQSLFKLHPDFDGILAEIAAGDPSGHIVLLDGPSVTWNELLRARWTANHPILLERIIFLPRQPQERFMALMAHFDVLLDPIYFGSGNTLYEAMLTGTPIVTWPGRFMRGRIVAGAYRQMGIANAPIAARLEDYAPLALALGRDPARRKALRQAALQGARELFDDRRAVREFENFLEAAVAAAGRGEKLPAGWQPV